MHVVTLRWPSLALKEQLFLEERLRFQKSRRRPTQFSTQKLFSRRAPRDSARKSKTGAMPLDTNLSQLLVALKNLFSCICKITDAINQIILHESLTHNHEYKY